MFCKYYSSNYDYAKLLCYLTRQLMLYQIEATYLTIYSCSGIINRYLFCLNNALDIRKRLAKLAGRKVAFYVVGKWIPAIVDHLFHVVMNTNKGPLRVAWWKSLVNHMMALNIYQLIFRKVIIRY